MFSGLILNLRDQLSLKASQQLLEEKQGMLNDQTATIRQDQVRLRTREPNPSLQDPPNRSQNKMRTLRKSNCPTKQETVPYKAY